MDIPWLYNCYYITTTVKLYFYSLLLFTIPARKQTDISFSCLKIHYIIF